VSAPRAVPLLVFACAILAGCAPRPVRVEPPAAPPAETTPPDPVFDWQPTRVDARAADPLLSQALSFAVVPAARVVRARAAVGEMDRRLLFSARNALEARGYRWVGAANPELIVALDWRAPEPGGASVAPFRTRWPSRVTALPGDIEALRIDPAWGTWSAVRAPRRPLEAAPWWTPAVQIAIFDSAEGTLLWQAEGHGSTEEPAPQVALPRVLDETAVHLPRATRPAHRLRAGEGRLGMRLRVATADGWRFYPRVEALAPGLPAEEMLEVGTWIVAVEGVSTANLALADLYDLLRGPPDTTTRMRVAAAGEEERTVYVVRAPQ